MSIDIYLDPTTHDIDITNNTMRLTQSIEESSRQQCEISLKTFRGEWPYNTRFGIPYLENDNNLIQLLGTSNKEALDLYVRRDILARENITRIVSYDSELDPRTRELTISFEAETNTGSTIVVNGTI